MWGELIQYLPVTETAIVTLIGVAIYSVMSIYDHPGHLSHISSHYHMDKDYCSACSADE